MILVLLCECKVIFNINRWAYEKKEDRIITKDRDCDCFGYSVRTFLPRLAGKNFLNDKWFV